MHSIRSFRGLIVAVAAFAVVATAADKSALAGQSFALHLNRDGQADGTDTLVFSAKTVESRVAGALFLGSAKYKARSEGDVVSVDGKAKCIDGSKGRLTAEVRGSAISGKLNCEGKTPSAIDFQGTLVGGAAPAAPQSSVSPTVPGSETGTGAAAPGNPAPAAPATTPAPATPAPAPATSAPAGGAAPGAH